VKRYKSTIIAGRLESQVTDRLARQLQNLGDARLRGDRVFRCAPGADRETRFEQDDEGEDGALDIGRETGSAGPCRLRLHRRIEPALLLPSAPVFPTVTSTVLPKSGGCSSAIAVRAPQRPAPNRYILMISLRRNRDLASTHGPYNYGIRYMAGIMTEVAPRPLKLNRTYTSEARMSILRLTSSVPSRSGESNGHRSHDQQVQ